MRIHVDAASGGFVAPFVYPDLEFDFRLSLVNSVSASGHKWVAFPIDTLAVAIGTLPIGMPPIGMLSMFPIGVLSILPTVNPSCWLAQKLFAVQ